MNFSVFPGVEPPSILHLNKRPFFKEVRLVGKTDHFPFFLKIVRRLFPTSVLVVYSSLSDERRILGLVKKRYWAVKFSETFKFKVFP